MAASPKGTRLSPPLMFAFREAHRVKDAAQKVDTRDAAGTRVVATRRSLRASVSEAQLRTQLAKDLDILMNTTNLDSTQSLAEFDQARRSIINFGLPDIVNRTIDEWRTESIVDEIRTAVLTYEPRLIPSTVQVTRDRAIDPATLNIRFFVTGEMSCDPVAVPVEFVADLEVASGKLALNKR